MHEYLSFVKTIKHLLDPKIAQDVVDIEYGQWEFPFEVILLELIKLPRNQISLDLPLIQRLANEADIIETGVLNIDTWKQFLSWYGTAAF